MRLTETEGEREGPMTKFFNRSSETAKRRVLRNSATDYEQILWRRLKGKQLDGLKFRRQFSVGPYIIDFYCPAVKLALELDGAIHNMGDQPQYDAERQAFIETFGIRFLRFSNNMIEGDIESVIETIRHATHLRITDDRICPE